MARRDARHLGHGLHARVGRSPRDFDASSSPATTEQGRSASLSSACPGLNDGCYFERTRGLGTLALATVVALALLLGERIEISRLEIACSSRSRG